MEQNMSQQPPKRKLSIREKAAMDKEILKKEIEKYGMKLIEFNPDQSDQEESEQVQEEIPAVKKSSPPPYRKTNL